MDAEWGLFQRNHLGPEALLMLTELLQDRRHRQEILCKGGSPKVNGGKSQWGDMIRDSIQFCREIHLSVSTFHDCKLQCYVVYVVPSAQFEI